MFRLLPIVVLFIVFCDVEADSGQVSEKLEKSARQKRLLFYDEEGNLVKTYKNPYFNDLTQTAGKLPYFAPYFSFFRPATFNSAATYMIPVSDQVIQKINTDPLYQIRLLTLPRKDLTMEPNTQCSGKRTQIPAKSCNTFLNCWDGWAFEQECPDGLLFSNEGYCDYPQNVDCSKRTNDSPSPAPSPPASQSPAAAPEAPSTPPQSAIPSLPAIPSQPIPSQPIPSQPIPSQPNQPQPSTHCTSGEFESFRNEEQCNEFFICVDSNPVKFQCPADLLYNQELGVCDYAHRVNCKESAPIIAAPIQSNPAPPCASPSSEGKDQVKPVVGSQKLPPYPIVPGVSRPLLGSILPLTGPLSNAIYNHQSWSSSHVAISRQDALRQLRLGENA